MQDRLDRLMQLAEVTAGRVSSDLTNRARDIADRAHQRLRLGQETVVALAGATGSGKSSLTNALTGAEVAAVGIRRPTTSETLAISFAPENRALLGWFGVRHRHEVRPPQPGFEPLVLLDLPDFDSTIRQHRAEVDRLVPVVDQFVWVLDPQKYADVVVHREYLAPLAPHREVMAVVLNQADRLRPNEVHDCVAHLEELLRVDGLTRVPVFAVSATTGQGVAELREYLVDVAAHKTAARLRLLADIDRLAADFGEACPGPASRAPKEELQAGLEAAAGVPQVIQAITQAVKQRGVQATGWPMITWFARFRPDQLRHLRSGSGDPFPAPALPTLGPVALAQVDLTLRGLADAVGEGLAPGWQAAIAAACRRDREFLPGWLDEAVAGADLGLEREPVWWQLVRILQWLLLASAAIGMLWLTLNLLLTYFGLPPLLGPTRGGLAMPALLTLGGIAAGVGLALGSRFFVAAGVQDTVRQVRAVLGHAVAAVGEEHVLTPLRAETARLEQARQLVREL
ncbi:MAG: 50S ribosome-binding GTPase [Propionibacteriaceae bacterium]|nr:50S ribosome-binding GTPase [Propionibacteriaceae bacterium]